jgi:hypothetical protein
MSSQIGKFQHFLLQSLLTIVAVLVVSSASLHAQNSQGTILGHVTDPSGAVVSGATVRVTNVATSVSRTAKTNAVGDYVFVNIPPGNYDVSVEAPGFSSSKASALRLDVEATLRQDFQVQVGAASQEITVTSGSQMVQTDNATNGNVVPSKLIDELPISGRDFTNLLRIQAGATEVQGSSTLYWAQHGLNTDFSSVSINGARTESVSYLVDGVSDNDQYFSTANNIPSSGSIEEFKVQNGLYSAEYGQGSAQVNVAIKSGGNQFHGTVYDYLQNEIFEPTNPFNVWAQDLQGVPIPPKDALKQNQYGFTLGGPVLIPKLYDGHNRTFFFYSYEAGRRRVSALSKVLVPSLAERNGDFSDWRDASGNLVPIYDPTTETGGNPATRTPFAGNQITSGFSTISHNYLNLYPAPNVPVANMADCAQTNGLGTGACYNYLTSVSHPYDTDNNTFRVDENLGSRDRFYLTGILGEQKFHNASAMPLTGEIKYQKNRLIGANWEHTITPNMFNQLRFGYNWMKWRNGSDATGGVNYGSTLGFANVPGNPALWGVPDIQLQGFQELGNTNSGWTQKENNYELVDNLKWINGKHALTVGTDIRRYMLFMIAAFGSTGQVSFNGAYTGLNPNLTNTHVYDTPGSGSPVADFLLGNPINVAGPAPGGSDYFDVRATNWNLFVQDDYRVTPKLTLNLGLRYEIPPAYHDIYNSGAQLDPTGGGGFLWANKNTAAQIQQQGGYPFISGCCADNKLVPTDKRDFAPRIGIAWRPFDTDRFVVRAGYGMFYDLQNQWYSLTTYDNISTYIGSSAFYPTESGTTNTANSPLDTLWKPSTVDYFFFGAGPNALPSYVPYPQINWPKNRSPYNQQWTLDTQYALKPNLLLDIGYVGSHSVRQPGYWYYNAATMPAIDDQCDHYRNSQEVQDAGDTTCLSDPNFVGAMSRNHFNNISTHAYAVANLFSASYNALQARLNQRFSHGLQYQLNYTWSRTYDNVSAINNIPTSSLTLQNNNCFTCDYGPASFDQPSRFVASGSYEIPIGKGRWLSFGPANWIVGGWDFSGIYTAASGFPETVFAGLGGYGEDGVRADLRRPNQVSDPNAPVYGQLNTTTYQQALFKSNIFHWFNPAAFAAPAGNQYGDAGRNSVRQPYFMRGDITLAKVFPITERQSFQFRMEIFNVFSLWHSNINGGPNGGGGIQGNMTSGNFGSLVGIDHYASGTPLPENLQSGIRQLWNPRTIQFTAKYSF